MNISSIHIPRRFVSHSWGGTETVVLESAKCLKAMGHPARVFTSCALSGKPGTAHSDEIDGVEVRRFPHFYPYLGLSGIQRESLDLCGGNLFSWSLLRALGRDREARVLHLHTAKRMGGIARTIGRLRKIPYVVSLHGGLFCRPESETRRQAKKADRTLEWGKALGWLVGSRRVMQEASAVLCLTESEKREVLAWNPEVHCRVLPNGVDLDRFSEGSRSRFREHHAIPADRKLMAVVGRVDPQKGQLVAVNAFSRLKDDSAHLLLAGPVTDSDYDSRIQSRIDELDLGDRVSRVGGLSGQELVDAYHASDVVIVPSSHEPFGIVVLEAWACRKPVVASRVGGLAELITENRDGRLFEADNDHELSTMLQHLLDNRNERQRLGRGGRGTAQGYSWRAHADKLTQIYQEVIHEHSLRQ
jgi:D-inositol-3-phosphate glycosyltransferase